MSAIGCHIARISMIPVSGITGQIINKNTATIADVLKSSTEPRVIADPAIPNTVGNPTIANYILIEAASGWVLYHIDQTMIVTYSGADLNKAS